MATHLPVNHHLRGLYRGLAGLTGVYLAGFGVAGILASRGRPFFDQGETEAWGLKTNMAFGVLSVIVGLVILIGVIIGHNVDRFINMIGAVVFLVCGLIMLTLSRSGLNFLNYDVSAAVVSFVIGTLLLLSGLYGRIGPDEQQAREEDFRHNVHHDPVRHLWSKIPPKKSREGRRFA
jgi:hypothetical protein